MNLQEQTTPEELVNSLSIPCDKKAVYPSRIRFWQRMSDPIEWFLSLGRVQFGIAAGLILLGAAIYLGAWVSARPTFLKVFPPDDLYIPLIEKPIDVSKVGARYTFTVRHKYRGTHYLGLLFNESIDFWRKDELNLRLDVTVMSGDEILLTRELGESYGGFYRGEKSSGFILLWYEVPDNLPVNKDLTFVITVVSPDPGMMLKHGTPHFYVVNSTTL